MVYLVTGGLPELFLDLHAQFDGVERVEAVLSEGAINGQIRLSRGPEVPFEEVDHEPRGYGL
jgi:hypothetical protein